MTVTMVTVQLSTMNSGGAPYVQVASAGNGHYVRLAQHVHHVMDHISE